MEAASGSIEQHLQALDWASLRDDLWQNGFAVTEPVLTSKECPEVVQTYRDDSCFRSHIIVARYRFGSGDYKYFAHPLPQVVQELREHMYPELADLANEWNEALGVQERFPKQHSQLLKVCAAHGQKKPTPLLLHYEAGDYNCLTKTCTGTSPFRCNSPAF